MVVSFGTSALYACLSDGADNFQILRTNKLRFFARKQFVAKIDILLRFFDCRGAKSARFAKTCVFVCVLTSFFIYNIIYSYSYKPYICARAREMKT